MKATKYNVLLTNCFLLVLVLLSSTVAFADDDDHKRNKSKYLVPVNNDTFKKKCGACHFAYQPGLLPSVSWEKILNNLPAHFGKKASLNQEQKSIISDYLRANAAEHSSAKRARKILKSLRGQTPLRITETPYIREKHNELDSNIFSRPSIGSRSNCIACHPTAEQGNYDDDFVKIPE